MEGDEFGELYRWCFLQGQKTTVYKAVPPRPPSAVVRVGELWEWFIQNCCCSCLATYDAMQLSRRQRGSSGRVGRCWCLLWGWLRVAPRRASLHTSRPSLLLRLPWLAGGGLPWLLLLLTRLPLLRWLGPRPALLLLLLLASRTACATLLSSFARLLLLLLLLLSAAPMLLLGAARLALRAAARLLPLLLRASWASLAGWAALRPLPFLLRLPRPPVGLLRGLLLARRVLALLLRLPWLRPHLAALCALLL